MITDKREKNCQIRDTGIPEDCGVRATEGDKIEKYQDFVREVTWQRIMKGCTWHYHKDENI